ncbi:MAG: zinc ribbon domain-containing protein [Dehalococcoidia bacterium]|nr:zinc ribbon domain-containing protein [Dehalococcoidia bacterium]
MPIYEYSCPAGHGVFELMRPVSRADEKALCPKCNKPSRRVFSKFACVSKGADGESTPLAGTGGSCHSCSSSSCATCGG